MQKTVDFSGTITGNQLPVHFTLFLQAPVNILGIRHGTVAKEMFCFWSYSPSILQRFLSAVG